MSHSDVIIQITYKGKKAARMSSVDNDLDFYNALKSELSSLKLPCPPMQNVHILSSGVQFFWTIQKKHPMRSSLSARVRDVSINETLKERYTIASIVFSEKSPFAPWSADPSRSTRGRLPRRSSSPTRPRRRRASLAGSSSPRPTSSFSPDRSRSTRKHLHPGTFSPPTSRRSSASPVRRVEGDIRPLSPDPTSSTFNSSNEPITDSSHVMKTEHIRRLDESLAALRRLNETITNSVPQQQTQAVGLRQSHAPPTDDMTRSSIEVNYGPPSQSNPAETQLSSRKNSNVLGDSNSEISRLTREFYNSRRQITAARARQAVVLEELRRLGAPNLPDIQSSAELLDANDIGTIDECLRAEMQLRQSSEIQLREERGRRLEAEQSLQDVERECRVPFVVPALMQAFLQVSKMSTESLSSI